MDEDEKKIQKDEIEEIKIKEINDDFKDIYSKINLIKQKHKEHSEEDEKFHFSINDYKIDLLMNDDKLKHILKMLEPEMTNYKFPYKNVSDLFSEYKFNTEKNKLFNDYHSNSNIVKMEKYKNSNNGITLNKIYSLFEDVNKMNKRFSPNKSNNYKKTLSYQPISNKYENKKIKITNNKYNFEKKFKPLINSEFLKYKNNNLNTLNDDFSNLKSKIKNQNKIRLNSFRNNKSISKENNIITINNNNWFDNFSEKYNNKFYSLEVNKLGNAIDKVGNYPNYKTKSNSLYKSTLSSSKYY
jgi:hypothetical protein